MKIPKEFIEKLKNNLEKTWNNNSFNRDLEQDTLSPGEIDEIIDETIKEFESGTR